MNTLESLLKAQMEYTSDPAPRCDTCVHCTETADQAGMWRCECSLNPAITLPVEATGRCKHHEPKVVP